MDCVNHSGVTATAYCQNCGKALCANCVRNAPGGQIFCEPCQQEWQGFRQPFVSPPPGVPSPAVAAVLGLIPGVGAMYNGQLIKGLIHVVIFAALISATNVWGIFGLLIAGWVFYQVFDAYHTAKARRDGEPLPDPLGLNEVSNLFGAGGRPHMGAHPQNAQGPGAPGPEAQPQAAQQGPGQAPYQGQYQSPYQDPYQARYQGPYAAPAAGFTEAGAAPMPPVPPPAPGYWRRREPVGAVVLIALGVLFLLAEFDVFSGRVFEYLWPILLIALGVWLIARRLGDSQGGRR